MNVKRYFANTAREALRLLKEDLGPDAIVLSNRSVDGGVEITAVLASEIPGLSPPAAPATPMAHADDDFTVNLSAGARQSAAERPAPEPKAARIVRDAPAPFARTRAREPALPAAPPPPARSRGPEGGRLSHEMTHELTHELAAIKGLIEQQLAGFAWRGMARQQPARTLLLADLLDAGFSAHLARRLVEDLPEAATREQGRNWLKGVLNRGLATLAADHEVGDRGGVYALVGPTGVGKTTTTAKLAARCVVRHGADSVALLTTDGYRIGAHEQLRIYGRILGVPVHAVRDAADLRQTLAELSDKHLVLIDTIGMSQRDRLVAEQADMLDSAGDVKRLLLLNATSRGDTLDDVVKAYGGAPGGGGLAGAVLTKVDEAASLAPAIDILIRHGLQLYYVANGQRVPEDLHLPNRNYLLHRALKEPAEDSPHRLAGDEAGLLLATGGARACMAARI
jgi:flagellar biosynthesis protein FlhF